MKTQVTKRHMFTRSASIVVVLLVVCSITVLAQTPPPVSFLPQVVYNTGLVPVSLTIGDLNGDGKPDLVVANSCGDDPQCVSDGTLSDGTVSVFLSKGDGTFQAAVNYTTAFAPVAVAVADFNGDRKPDLVVLNKCGTDPNCGEQTGGSLSVFLGNGDGTFPAATIYDLVFHPVSVAVGDFNGDGNLDLALGSDDDNDRNVAILLGNGDGTFRVPVYYVAGVQPTSLAVADFDGDGNPDLVMVTVGYTARLNVLLGNGNGTFRAPVYYSAGTYPTSVAVGDFNGDGKPDLAVANADETLSVLLNNGNGTFKAAVNYGDRGTPQSVAVGDFNGDSRPDLVTANLQYDRVSVFLGNGDGTFQRQLFT